MFLRFPHLWIFFLFLFVLCGAYWRMMIILYSSAEFRFEGRTGHGVDEKGQSGLEPAEPTATPSPSPPPQCFSSRTVGWEPLD